MPLQAASYYVDFVGGSDASAGTSTGTAWQHCPGDANATGTAGAATFSAGDFVYFKGGVTNIISGGGNYIALNWSGTAGSPITYDGNSSGGWGTGRAIITDQHAAVGHVAFNASATRSNLIFRSLIIQEMGGSATLPTDTGSPVAANNGYGITFDSVASPKNITVRDCDFNELGYYWNAKPMDTSSIDGVGISLVNSTGTIISNCNFSRVSCGVRLSASTTQSNIVVANCNFTDSIRWGIDINSVAANAYHDWITVKNCTIHDYFQFDSGAWTGYGDWPHTDGIFFRQDYNGVSYGTNNNFYGNSFYSTSSTGGGTAEIYVTEGPSVNIYNNTWRYSGKGRIIYVYNTFNPSNTQQINIFNNSFIINYTPAVDIEGPGYDNTTINVKNNIFYDVMTGSGNNFCVYLNTTNVMSGLTFDYNLYKTFNSGNTFFSWNGGEYTVVTLRSSRHFETNGIQSDPLFSALGTAASPLSADLNLRTNSAAKDVGVSLAAYFTTDKIGTARPQGSAWDIGAYELGAGSQAAASVSPASLDFGAVLAGSVTNLAFTIQNTGGGTLSGSATVPAPFSIVSGGSYSLAAGQSQVVTVRYAPTSAGTDSQSVTFTGGTGATQPVSGSSYSLPVVSAISQNAADVDPITPGVQIYGGSVVQFSGSASDPSGYPLAWQWLYSLNGSPEILVLSGTGTVAAISFNYLAGAAGNSYLWKLRVGNGYAIVESTLTVGVIAPPPAGGGLTFQAGAGAITAPFVLTNGYLSQSVQTTDPTAGGRVAYTFTNASAGNFAIQVLVDAPSDGNNSFFVNMDAEPLAPTMICDIPLTSGFEQRMVSWRGNGTDVNNQFVPKTFALPAGVHQFIIRGREGNVQLQRIAIGLEPPKLRIVGTGP